MLKSKCNRVMRVTVQGAVVVEEALLRRWCLS